MLKTMASQNSPPWLRIVAWILILYIIAASARAPPTSASTTALSPPSNHITLRRRGTTSTTPTTTLTQPGTKTSAKAPATSTSPAKNKGDGWDAGAVWSMIILCFLACCVLYSFGSRAYKVLQKLVWELRVRPPRDLLEGLEFMLEKSTCGIVKRPER